jgi:hypothetical protein
MDIKQLKNKIEHKEHISESLIFLDSKDDNIHFIMNQYIHEIIINSDREVVFVESLEELISLKGSNNLFGISDCLVICSIEVLDVDVSDLEYSIVICKKISDDLSNRGNIIKINQLDNWCVEDYILSRCEFLSREDAVYIMKYCKNNLFKIENELDKFCIFESSNRYSIFEDIKYESVLDDTTSNSMFDLANSIINGDLNKLGDLWGKVDLFDSDPMWLISILISQYKTIIDVFLHPNSTPEYCGISQKRFNAIKYYNKNYSRQQLIDIFMFLNGIDSKLKSGELSDVNLLDYVIIGVIQRRGKIT